jgi:hypothetical protein
MRKLFVVPALAALVFTPIAGPVAPTPTTSSVQAVAPPAINPTATPDAVATSPTKATPKSTPARTLKIEARAVPVKRISRSAVRTPLKRKVVVRASVNSGNPHAVAAAEAARYGWGASQLSCLNLLWNRESGWNYLARNPSSGAYGIPQALPGSKMASAGADWRSSARTQIRWGLGYIQARYGSPCGAWGHSRATGWY